MKNLKKNQVVIFVIALMLVAAGYLNFTNEQNLIATSSLADSEQMAAIGDATLVSANQVLENSINSQKAENIENVANVGNVKNNENITNSANIGSNENIVNNTNTINENMTNTENTENKVNDKQDESEDSNSYFTQSKLDRDAMYSQTLENYQKILEADNLSSEEKSLAQEEIKKINNEKNAIMIAENLIKTKGIEDAVLFVNNGNVTVIIKAEKLEENQVAQIQNIITRELNVKANKVNISCKN